MKKFLMFRRFLANIEFYPIDIDGVKYAVIHFSKKIKRFPLKNKGGTQIMVVTTVTYHVFPGKRNEFIKAIVETNTAAKTLNEEGCLEYRFSLPIDSEDELCLLERWESPEHLVPHRTQPHFLLLQEIKAKYVEHTDITRYETK